MSRYVLMQEQLDGLLEQIKRLNQINEAKDERIKELERHRSIVYGSENAGLISTITELEDEIHNLKNQNKELTNIRRDSTKKIQELENLLEEERKLRLYSETLAKEVEQQCAKETLVRELTTELCQLQKDEIEIENKRILELQKKIKRLSKQMDSGVDVGGYSGKTNQAEKNLETITNNPTIARDIHINSVIRRLRAQLLELRDQFNSNPLVTEEDRKQKKNVDTWLAELGDVVEDMKDIQEIRKDLKQMKYEIEDRRKLSMFHHR
ncbi:hypothetical protein RUM43_007919 [Polyplax serrata]|uniref:Uncharacterized protein n=1 Tax=Polyplax serrata TaxID=468196 RepID=A0AAN8SA98_POLSC